MIPPSAPANPPHDPPMYIEKTSNGYRAHVQKNGRRKSALWPTKREATDWGRKTELEFASSPGETGRTLGEAVAKYLADVSSKKEGEKWERLRLAAMLGHFGDVPLSSINQPEIGAWRDKRLETVSGSTVQRERNLLRNVFARARVEWHWMDNDPFKGVDMPDENDPRTALWGWKRIRRVLRYLGYVSGAKPETHYQQAALAFLIGLHTSLRASEILRVNKETFNAATRVIRVKTKTMKLAQVPVTRRAVKVCKLADFTISAVDLDVLFRKARDGTMAGDLTFHDSRAFALTMLARKVDVLTLSRISQHKDLKMLMRYYRESAESVAARI